MAVSQNIEIATGATGNIFSGDPVKMLNTGTILVAGAAGDLYWECSEDVSLRIVQVRRSFLIFLPTATTSSDIVAFVEDDPIHSV